MEKIEKIEAYKLSNGNIVETLEEVVEYNTKEKFMEICDELSCYSRIEGDNFEELYDTLVENNLISKLEVKDV